MADPTHGLEPADRERFERIVSKLARTGWELIPVPEASLVEFERRWRVQLPPSYRALLATVGPRDLLPLGEVPADFGEPAEALLARLSQPFPVEAPALEESTPIDFDPSSMNRGWLPLAEERGGLTMLVCTGPERGQVWNASTDDPSGEGDQCARAAPFLEWYEGQLDDTLGALAELNALTDELVTTRRA